MGNSQSKKNFRIKLSIKLIELRTLYLKMSLYFDSV